MPEIYGRRWSREETIIALALYCRIPFAKSNKTHPKVVRVANIIGRSPSSVHMKIGNFGSFDPQLRESGIVGLINASKLDSKIWHEFNNNWEGLAIQAFDLEQKIISVGKKSLLPDTTLPKDVQRLGAEKIRLTHQRINQNFFRQTILAAYGGNCCITGINIPEILIASHIKPWAKCTPSEQLNPHNGLCLNALHDRAFDRGFITLSEKYKVKVSGALKKSDNVAVQQWLVSFDGKEMQLPEKFMPSADFLSWHRKNIFKNT